MAIEKIHIDQFLEMSARYPVLDVRSPSEYRHAHIPGAISFPLFTDDERKMVGTTYKQQSRELAIKLGLEYFGPRMKKVVEEAEAIVLDYEKKGLQRSNGLLIHCWRGGMRSAAIAWLLDLYGFKVYTLIGGYKKFRHWVIDRFSDDYDFKILGGYTGSDKTGIIQELKKQGERIIDLEAIACHKGSAFGNIGMPDQPSQEMFENLLGWELHKLHQQKNDSTYTWLEDESQRIGHVNIPQVFWERMRNSPVCFIDIPFEERLKHIVVEYGNLDKERMLNAIERISKRLGGLETKLALQHLQENEIEPCFRILLKYYDKWYKKGLNSRPNLNSLLTTVSSTSVQVSFNTSLVLDNQVSKQLVK